MTGSTHGNKVAVVIDGTIPAGLAANTASVLTLSLGHHVGSIIGPELKDADGSTHPGITTLPIPILTAATDTVKDIRNRANAPDSALVTVDFTDCAQRTRTYDDYAELLHQATDADITYLGVAMYGPSKHVNRLTGSLPLLR